MVCTKNYQTTKINNNIEHSQNKNIFDLNLFLLEPTNPNVGYVSVNEESTSTMTIQFRVGTCSTYAWNKNHHYQVLITTTFNVVKGYFTDLFLAVVK